jgi:hypothetical protein
MRTICLFFIFTCLYCLQVSAQTQNSLIGTWKLVSQLSEDENGKPITHNASKVKEYKIITPTHFMWIAEVKGDTGKYAGGGTYTFSPYDGKYIETVQWTSLPDLKKTTFDLTMKVEGNKLRQTGWATLHGKKYPQDETWEKVNLPAQPVDDAIGTWQLVSYKATGKDGKEQVTDKSQMKLIRVITPTHWMQIGEALQGSKSTFAYAVGGTHSLKNGKVMVKSDIGTVPYTQNEWTELTYKVEGDKILHKGTHHEADGSIATFSDEFQRIGARPKLAKTSSAN